MKRGEEAEYGVIMPAIENTTPCSTISSFVPYLDLDKCNILAFS